MAVDYGRIHRLLKILTLIQGSDGWTAARLAQECRVKERTIYRDLKMLEGAGIPYAFDQERRCYRIHGDFFMPPVQLTVDESLALVALSECVGRDEQVPYTKAAAKAVEKVRGLLPPKLREQVERITPHIAMKLAATAPPESAEDVYETVRQALARRSVLHCLYESTNGTSANGTNGSRLGKPFKFRPYTLLFNQRAWYVIGHHDGRGEIRCLKLARFTHLKSLPESYEIPESFNLRKHLGNAWRMIRGKQRYEVELHFDAEFADTVSDTHWHATQEVEWLDDGSILFRCQVDGLEEIVWWVLSMGPHCVVRKPEVLAKQVSDLLAATMAKYQPVAALPSGSAKR